MTSIDTNVKIYLEPIMMNKNIRKHLNEEIERKLKNKCIYNYGYVKNINKINTITNTKSNVFIIDCNIEVFKPEKDVIYETIVHVIYKEGIFVEVNNLQKILIPKLHLHGYQYDEFTNVFIDKNKNIIQPGMSVHTKVLAVKYNNNSFSCIGELI